MTPDTDSTSPMRLVHMEYQKTTVDLQMVPLKCSSVGQLRVGVVAKAQKMEVDAEAVDIEKLEVKIALVNFDVNYLADRADCGHLR